MKNRLAVFLFLISAGSAFSQEALKSDLEEYYYFLSLQGLVERPTLNYRTLSDSVWDMEPGTDHPWKDNRLKSTYTFFEKFHLRVYGPELFMSFNTAVPYGQNDGALWQGKGFNTSYTTGARLEAYGIEATFKPQLAFSQNMGFDILPPANYDTGYDSPYGYFWAYGHNEGIDAPQRFGNKPFFTLDWGDTEIRYTWKTLTVGVGTQAIWLGPAWLNPILHSNNAPSYPKFDIGLRKQRIVIPKLDWYIGDMEFRLWSGMLTESDYFDNNPDNNRTMIHGLSFAYAPSFLPGFVLSMDRICLVPWSKSNLKYIIPLMGNTMEDQKFSFSISYGIPSIGLGIFGELGIDDFPDSGARGYLKYPFHTMVYSFGLRKTMTIKQEKKIYGELALEFNMMEMSQNFQFEWPYSYYFHRRLTHGYTQKGQYIGNAVSPGGNSQALVYTLYYPKGYYRLLISRNNPDNNFLYKDAIYDTASKNANLFSNTHFFKANFLFGVSTQYFINKNFAVNGGILYDLIINPRYKYLNDDWYSYLHNISISAGLKYSF
jgi:hypothetical protein